MRLHARGGGVPLPNGVRQCLLPRKSVRFCISKWRLLVYSGRYFLQLSCVFYTQKCYRAWKSCYCMHADIKRRQTKPVVNHKRAYSVTLCVVKHCYWMETGLLKNYQKNDSIKLEGHSVERTTPPRSWNRAVTWIQSKNIASVSFCHTHPSIKFHQKRFSSCWEIDKRIDWQTLVII